MAAPDREPLSVVFLDDHVVFSEALCQRLLDLELVRDAVAATTVTEAVRLIHERKPDVVFVDLHLADASGLDLLPRIAALSLPPPVGVLSAYSAPATIARALQAGAGAWVVKNGRLEEVAVAAEALHRGQTYVSPEASGRLIRLLLDAREAEHVPTFVNGLSPRSYAVLRCLVSGMTRQEAAARLYMSPNTVRTHVQKLLRVSDTHSTLALVAAARSCGVREFEDAARGGTVAAPVATSLT